MCTSTEHLALGTWHESGTSHPAFLTLRYAFSKFALTMWPWLFAALALVVAALAWVRARAIARRLERLTHSYWELRYEFGELREQINRLDPERRKELERPQSQAQQFVPLSSLKR